jgi:hypothetical protein
MNKKKLFEKLKNEKLVIKKGPWYYYVNGDNTTTQLSNKLEISIDKAIEIYEGKENTTPPSIKGNLQSGTPKTQNELDEAPKKITSKENDKFAELLGLTDNTRPYVEAGLLDIYIEGVNSKRANYPLITKCPLYFLWKLKVDNVDNGSGFTNRGSIVVL